MVIPSLKYLVAQREPGQRKGASVVDKLMYNFKHPEKSCQNLNLLFLSITLCVIGITLSIALI